MCGIRRADILTSGFLDSWLQLYKLLTKLFTK